MEDKEKLLKAEEFETAAHKCGSADDKSKAQQSEFAAKAECLFLELQDPDKAIIMYKKLRRFEDMRRLVETHRSGGCHFSKSDTHMQKGRIYELHCDYTKAEGRYVEAGTAGVEKAIAMYLERGMLFEAATLVQEVATPSGALAACKKTVLTYLTSISEEVALAHLLGPQFGHLIHPSEAVVFSVTQAEAALRRDEKVKSQAFFDRALFWAQMAATDEVDTLYLNRGMSLEDHGHYKEAEAAFKKSKGGSGWTEAVEMYAHEEKWDDAERVALECGGPEALADMEKLVEAYCLKRGMALEDEGHYKEAETFFKKSPGGWRQAVDMFIHEQLWADAKRVALECGGAAGLSEVEKKESDKKMM